MSDRQGRRGTVLMLLSVAAGSTDATSYLGLGHVFPANMTGNTVLLGIGLATDDLSSAGRSAVALGGFVLGAAVRTGYRRSHSLAVDLWCETALLIGTLAWWLTVGDPVRDGTRLGLIALLSTAMGWQSAAITRLDVGVSTTFITGTWTAASVWFAGLIRRPPDAHESQEGDRPYRRLVVLACYLAAACLAGYVFHIRGAWATLIPLTSLAAAAALTTLPPVRGPA